MGTNSRIHLATIWGIAGFLVGLLPARTEAIPAPLPGFGADTGFETTATPAEALAIELFDLGDLFQGEAGFFFADDPSTLHPVFEGNDTGFGGTQSALINFNTGLIFDLDEGALQSTFTPSTSAIGYYVIPVSQLGIVFYSIAALNPGGVDLMGFYPNLNGPGNLIGFSEPAANATISYHFVVGSIEPVIPEPASLGLVGLGLTFAGGLWRRRGRTAAR